MPGTHDGPIYWDYGQGPREVRFHVGHIGTATCGPGCPAWVEPKREGRLQEALTREDDEGTVYSITNAAPPANDDPEELEQ